MRPFLILPIVITLAAQALPAMAQTTHTTSWPGMGCRAFEQTYGVVLPGVSANFGTTAVSVTCPVMGLTTLQGGSTITVELTAYRQVGATALSCRLVANSVPAGPLVTWPDQITPTTQVLTMNIPGTADFTVSTVGIYCTVPPRLGIGQSQIHGYRITYVTP